MSDGASARAEMLVHVTRNKVRKVKKKEMKPVTVEARVREEGVEDIEDRRCYGRW